MKLIGGVPWDHASVLGGQPESELEDKESQNVDSTITECGTLHGDHDMWVQLIALCSDNKMHEPAQEGIRKQSRTRCQEDRAIQQPDELGKRACSTAFECKESKQLQLVG